MKAVMTVSALALSAALSFGALAQTPTTAPATPTAPAAAKTALTPMMSTAPQTKTAEAATPKPVVRHPTMSRHRVEEIQAALNGAGENLAVDGIWGPKTKSALGDYQRKNGLQITDSFDHQTAGKLSLPNWQQA